MRAIKGHKWDKTGMMRYDTSGGDAMLVNRLSRLMGERRLSIQDVVRGTGISYSTVHDLYHDRRRRIDFDTLDKLCRFFQVDTNLILEWQPSAEQPKG
jgi:putative transcriptional regulator